MFQGLKEREISTSAEKNRRQLFTLMMAPEVEKINAIPRLEVGKGPHWDEKRQIFYLVDMFNGKLGKYCPSRDSYEEIKVGEPPLGFVVPVKGEPNKFVAALGLDIKLIQWDAATSHITQLETLATVPETSTRINDGKCDPSGRLWFGTTSVKSGAAFEKNAGGWYSFTRREGLRKQESDVSISNGSAFPRGQNVMYYIDTDKQKIGKYSFDIGNAKIKLIDCVFDAKESYHKDAMPDGMTIDENGNLWVAMFKMSRVLNIDPVTKKVLQTVEIPDSNQVSSAVFGGPDLSELYVTTAGHLGFGPTDKDSGRTFRVRNLGVKGWAASEFDFSA